MSPRVREIISDTARRHGLSFKDLIGDARFAHIVAARWEAMVAIRAITDRRGRPLYSYARIGEFFGGRDHTSVRYAILQTARDIASVQMRRPRIAWSSDQLSQLREMGLSGASQLEAANAFGVPYHVINNAVRRKAIPFLSKGKMRA